MPGFVDDEASLHNLTERELTERWAVSGDQQAASELWRRYLEILLNDASRQRSTGSDDSVTGSAFRSFLRQAQTKTFDFDRDDWLWRFLGKIAYRKRQTRLRKTHLTQMPGVLSDPPPPVDRNIGPEQAAAYNEVREALLKGLSPREQQWFEWRETGMPQVEIALHMGIGTRQVRRITRTVEQKVSRLFGDHTDRDGTNISEIKFE
ncbi:MAG: RNA polymerase sigma factor [Planctomycetaceae bacterium]|jgi:DNA-directed RNA polymerase specialized sigma24 family protein